MRNVVAVTGVVARCAIDAASEHEIQRPDRFHASGPTEVHEVGARPAGMRRACTMTALLFALSTAASTAGDDASHEQVSRGPYFSWFADYAACHTVTGGNPFAAYTRVARHDTAALWDYIRTVEPVSHAVTSNGLRLPFN
jgi:hypothetical protein